MEFINCYFTGRAGRRLFTVYEPPTAAAENERAVVLCYPLGSDYFNSHRAFVRLSSILSAGGAHVLRFDWYGTGDSSGEPRDGDLQGWLHDLSTAIDELKLVSGLHRVWLVGLRFGAALALLGAHERRDIHGVLLWDPVVDGAAHVAELLQGYETIGGMRSRRQGGTYDAGVPAVAGALLTERLREELVSIDTDRLLSASLPRVILLASEDKEEYRRFSQQMLDRGIEREHEVVASAQAWVETREQWAGEIPLELLQRLDRSVR